VTRLANPPVLVRWNTDKHYLIELARAGVATIPSTFLESEVQAAEGIADFSARAAGADFVVKPAVGAGSRDAQRYPPTALAAATAHALRLLSKGRSVLLQPYLESVDVTGETALIYFSGRFSHAICKGSLLRRDAGPTEALFAPETITPRTAAPDELAVGAQALEVLMSGALKQAGGAPLYARVDLLRDAAGAPRVLEMELTEPSLFFRSAPGSAARLAEAIDAFARASSSHR